MIPLVFLVAVSADLDALDNAVSRCDRGFANPAFSSEAGRRSQFLLDAYREQESIVMARLDISQRRRDLREAGAKKNAAEEAKLGLEDAALEDRQRALNDQRMLEGIRQDAMDSMRRYFLLNCPAGKTDK
ncbi:hypothetical protein LZ016_12935 [Sphingomonas sp. SM33]|uniref:Uncharacterized protein n=1 Tax=Sphingomonas telluris TaxID=2907998 RepID=A0ABS9VR51_9SPHN|nr:hypothetical protein [Sphingomonas telluris]MCH8616999.1 hypothetical protein [Sphingomonas telluris]